MYPDRLITDYCLWGKQWCQTADIAIVSTTIPIGLLCIISKVYQVIMLKRCCKNTEFMLQATTKKVVSRTVEVTSNHCIGILYKSYGDL